jgi:hypothetical protein
MSNEAIVVLLSAMFHNISCFFWRVVNQNQPLNIVFLAQPCCGGSTQNGKYKLPINVVNPKNYPMYCDSGNIFLYDIGFITLP